MEFGIWNGYARFAYGFSAALRNAKKTVDNHLASRVLRSRGMIDSERASEWRASREDGQDIRDRSLQFACDVVGFCEKLEEGKRVGQLMVSQLLGCSLSFAAMPEEARAAESDKDFISKCSIGLKECRESWTRLRV